jgi:hypothetical protein
MSDVNYFGSPALLLKELLSPPETCAIRMRCSPFRITGLVEDSGRADDPMQTSGLL